MAGANVPTAFKKDQADRLSRTPKVESAVSFEFFINGDNLVGLDGNADDLTEPLHPDVEETLLSISMLAARAVRVNYQRKSDEENFRYKEEDSDDPMMDEYMEDTLDRSNQTKPRTIMHDLADPADDEGIENVLGLFEEREAKVEKIKRLKMPALHQLRKKEGLVFIKGEKKVDLVTRLQDNENRKGLLDKGMGEEGRAAKRVKSSGKFGDEENRPAYKDMGLQNLCLLPEKGLSSLICNSLKREASQLHLCYL
ncbi:hypothetical protein HYALB_00008210 [Hymenoscyphus albidus]|uniref:Uncharacterized protein n=1 Tax=Hymenoscyphus albidus TaxID=595503 RepID=A0A9N9LYR7_9HELO|nr:hypothetical protein HYALB_00008210 [Hymenoscyphus albidus]